MIKITMICFCEVHMSPASTIKGLCEKINTYMKSCTHMCKDHWGILLAFVSMCVVGKSEYTNWGSMSYDTITQGRIRGLVSPFHICG